MKDNLKVAVAAIIVAVFGLSLGDAVVKAISANLSIWQLYVMRSAIALPILIGFIKLTQPSLSLRPRALGWTAMRSLLLVFMWLAYYVALPHVELSIAAAAYYTSPLFITLLAAPMAGERVGRNGWLAIALGFLGVLIMLKPDAKEFNFFALLPILAAFLYALAMLLTRTKCRRESPLILSLGLILAFIIVGAAASLIVFGLKPSVSEIALNPFLFSGWVIMNANHWIALLVMAGAILIGSIFAAIAYQSGPATTVATFDYFYVGFSVLWGVVIFSEFPAPWTIFGMSLIALAGLIAIRR